MTKDEMIEVLILLNQIEGFARANMDGKLLPEDIWNKIMNVSEMLAEYIKENK